MDCPHASAGRSAAVTSFTNTRTAAAVHSANRGAVTVNCGWMGWGEHTNHGAHGVFATARQCTGRYLLPLHSVMQAYFFAQDHGSEPNKTPGMCMNCKRTPFEATMPIYYQGQLQDQHPSDSSSRQHTSIAQTSPVHSRTWDLSHLRTSTIARNGTPSPLCPAEQRRHCP
jgi:hypothetical protein